MTQPHAPEDQQPQYAAASREQQYQQGVQTSAPSAYSAPGAAPYGQQAPGQYAQQGYPQQGYGQPAYGQAYAYQAPHQGGGLGAFFSLDFSQKFGSKIARLVMIFAFIVAGAIAVAALFNLISVLSQDYAPAMYIVSGIFEFVRDCVFAFFLVGLTRVILETAVKEEKGESAAA